MLAEYRKWLLSTPSRTQSLEPTEAETGTANYGYEIAQGAIVHQDRLGITETKLGSAIEWECYFHYVAPPSGRNYLSAIMSKLKDILYSKRFRIARKSTMITCDNLWYAYRMVM